MHPIHQPHGHTHLPVNESAICTQSWEIYVHSTASTTSQLTIKISQHGNTNKVLINGFMVLFPHSCFSVSPNIPRQYSLQQCKPGGNEADVPKTCLFLLDPCATQEQVCLISQANRHSHRAWTSRIRVIPSARSCDKSVIR